MINYVPEVGDIVRLRPTGEVGEVLDKRAASAQTVKVYLLRLPTRQDWFPAADVEKVNPG